MVWSVFCLLLEESPSLRALFVFWAWISFHPPSGFSKALLLWAAALKPDAARDSLSQSRVSGSLRSLLGGIHPAPLLVCFHFGL